MKAQLSLGHGAVRDEATVAFVGVAVISVYVDNASG